MMLTTAAGTGSPEESTPAGPGTRATPDSVARAGSPRRHGVMLILVTVLTVVLDLVTKAVAAAQLHLALPVNLIDGYLRFTLVNNTGTAFGLFPGRRILFLIFSCVAIVAILVLFVRLRRISRLQILAMGLLLGGALGNLHDRVRFGPVTDFIEMGIAGHYWPVFNVADAAITIGVVLLAWTMMRHDRSIGLEAGE